MFVDDCRGSITITSTTHEHEKNPSDRNREIVVRSLPKPPVAMHLLFARRAATMTSARAGREIRSLCAIVWERVGDSAREGDKKSPRSGPKPTLHLPNARRRWRKRLVSGSSDFRIVLLVAPSRTLRRSVAWFATFVPGHSGVSVAVLHRLPRSVQQIESSVRRRDVCCIRFSVRLPIRQGLFRARKTRHHRRR